MKRILRWEIPIDDAWHEIPGGGRFLYAWRGNDVRSVQIWVEVNGTILFEPVMYRVFATGTALFPGSTYVGTAVDERSGGVWHVYRRPKDE